MKINMTPVAAAICALALTAGAGALAASPMMGAPGSADVQAAQALVAKLAAQRTSQGLDADHRLSSSPTSTRASKAPRWRAPAHTYKGVRVFGSESVVVINAAGQILSESVSDRRLYLGRGPANKLGAATASFSVKPAITPQAAIAVAVKSQPRPRASRWCRRRPN